MTIAKTQMNKQANQSNNAELIMPAQYRADIDGLRAIAVLSVVAYHASPNKLSGGFTGVDIFFVISGFLISSIILRGLESNTFSFIDFYIRRIRRIFPALLIVLTSCYALGWFVLLADEYKQLGKHIAAGTIFASNFVLWNESGYFDTSTETKPLLHLWSLGIEEQFYIFWPILVWLAWKKRFNVLWMVASLALISFALNLIKVKSDIVAVFYSPLTRCWELLAGALLAYFQSHYFRFKSNFEAIPDSASDTSRLKNSLFRNSSKLPELASIIGVSLILAGMVLVSKQRSFPGYWALLPVIGTVMTIAAGSHTWLNRTILSNRVLVWFGMISFPLYLWHWPLLSFAQIIESERPNSFIRYTAVLLSILLAWLTYKVIEKPLRFGRHERNKAFFLVVFMVSIGAIGYYTYANDGIDSRAVAQLSKLNRFDRPYQESCNKLTGAAYGDDWCNSGTSSSKSPDIVVLGDSFSNAYSPLMSAYVKNSVYAHSFVQFARGQCPSLIDFGPAFCKEITDKSLDFIKNNQEISTVVLAANWPAYFDGKDFHWVTFKESPEAFKNSLRKTVLTYQKLGKKVVVFLPPPVGSNPKACVVRPLRLSSKDICNLPYSQALGNEGKYREWMLPFLAELGVKFYDPFPIFCSPVKCTIISENKILSADGGHLSIYGGEYLAQFSKPVLDSLFDKQ